MPGTAIICGILLIVVGLAGYLYGVAADRISMTALIPAAIGVVLALLGIAARRNEGPRKHLMHGALVIALLGFLATAGRFISKLMANDAGPASVGAADVSTIATALICLAFIVLGIRSFGAARG